MLYDLYDPHKKTQTVPDQIVPRSYYFALSLQKPKRYHELTAIHGHLDPLVNVDMEPATHVKVIFFLSFFEKNCAYLPLQAHVTNEGSDIQNLSLGFWKSVLL